MNVGRGFLRKQQRTVVANVHTYENKWSAQPALALVSVAASFESFTCGERALFGVWKDFRREIWVASGHPVAYRCAFFHRGDGFQQCQE